MKILITGGGGFLGSRLAQVLLKQGTLADVNGEQVKIEQITLLDIAFPGEADPRLKYVAGDLTSKAVLEKALDKDTTAVFHLASVVSGAAEADFDLGMRVNLDGTRYLLDACRNLDKPPRVIFTSSLAVFGGKLPPILDDTTTPKPQSSYGVQKVCGEYLIRDYSRKGYIDGRALRLPTISVRPGKPNLAASSFASGIIREPLNGIAAPCPVSRETELWLLSPGKVIDALIHAHDLPTAAWEADRVVNLPGITTSVGEMVDALQRVAGEKVVSLIEWKPDARIQAIILTWPVRFNTDNANKMGFKSDEDFEEIIRYYVSSEGIKV